MSELQIGLLAIGVLVVAGVLVYNRVQEVRARREAQTAFRSGHDDVLLGTSVSAQRPEGAPAGAAVQARETAPEERRPPVSGAAPAETVRLDPVLDYIVEFSADHPVAQGALREQWSAIERRHARRVILAGSAESKSWRAGLQLVSRDGAIGEADLIEFRSAVETLAASVGAAVSAPEMRVAVDAARELDQFCAESDIQVVVHVTGGPFAGTKIRAVAESSGLQLEADGRFAMRNDQQRLLYTLGARDGMLFAAASMSEAAPEALTLALDVTRVPDTRRVFESMARLAHQLAATLDGRMVDDNGSALDERAVAAIAAQLESVCARLEARGVPPGSPAALRLFS